MSTKCSIAYGSTFHLYHEVADDSYVYLELEQVPFEASYNRVMVPIPVHIWEVIRQHPGVDLSWVEKTDEEIRLHVEQEVQQRIQNWEDAIERNKSLLALLGAGAYGPADLPEAEQLQNGIQYFQNLRAHQQQIKDAIQKLANDNK